LQSLIHQEEIMLDKPIVAVVMGSQSDWETMQHSVDTLKKLAIPYHAQVISAHRTPDLLFQFAASARGNGYQVIIAGAGGAAHLPGMLAAKTSLPVLGVPVQSKALQGLDSLLSIVQMPGGIPVGSLAIGKAGAINAALLAAAIISLQNKTVLQALEQFRSQQTEAVLANNALE
jgi:5-(carboxyamino)imidazole ribonucleotide mutase